MNENGSSVMDCEQQFMVWSHQVAVLSKALEQLSETSPKNLLKHFFLQVVENEFRCELESTKSMIKNILCAALDEVETLEGSARQRAATILKNKSSLPPILGHIKLADIRNIAVFEIYKQCGITIDTYFERFQNPPGRPEEIAVYSQIAHGGASASAEKTTYLSNILVYMQVLKRFFTIYDSVCREQTVQFDAANLNWVAAMWHSKMVASSLGELIWDLFLDIYTYEL